MKPLPVEAPGRGRLSRREFLRLLRIGLLDLSLLTVGGAIYGFMVEPAWVRVEPVQLKLRRLAPEFSGLRIVQVSDIHIGGWMNAERFQRVAELVVEQKPDVLLLTGDFLIGRVFNATGEQHLQELVTILAPLAGPIPTFGVLGNHDYWTKAGAVREMLRASGVTELTNSVVTLSRGNAKLHLCGVDDVWEGQVRLEEVTAKLKDESAAILLAHEPDFADVSAATDRFDLQVSGHSHGGQVVLPFLGPPILPYLGQKYPSGLYKIGNMILYTNRGVGTGRVPVRINCPPEITVFTLESSA